MVLSDDDESSSSRGAKRQGHLITRHRANTRRRPSKILTWIHPKEPGIRIVLAECNLLPTSKFYTNPNSLFIHM